MLAASSFIHHLATVLLENARSHGLSDGLSDISEPMPGEPWNGRDLANLMHVLSRQMQDQFFGLAASSCPVSAHAFATELMVLSETLGDALRRAFRLYNMIADGLHFSLAIEGRTACLNITAADPSLDPHHFLVEWNTTRLHGIAQWLIAEEIMPTSVCFTHGPALPLSAYAEAFGVNVLFDQPVSRLCFPSRYLDRSVVRDIADISKLFSGQYGGDRTEYIHRSWRGLLKSALCARLQRKGAVPTMEELAAEFGVGAQTLRRRLREEGYSYRQIKAEARHDVVLHGFSDGKRTLGQISLLAGFAEPNGLGRAMRSWTGLSPSAYRKVVGRSPAGIAAASQAGERIEH